MLSGCTFSILGDSYSTFSGYIPEDNVCYYPDPKKVDDVLSVQDTWWFKLIEQKGMQLLVNDSYSGATMCTCVRETQPASSSFVERVHNLYCADERIDPNYVFVFGGTNDCWLKRTVGQVKHDGLRDDLKKILPAYCYILKTLSTVYKRTKIISVVNTGLNSEVVDGMILANNYYGAITVKLHDIDKQNGHPSALGMCQITEQICECLEQHFEE